MALERSSSALLLPLVAMVFDENGDFIDRFNYTADELRTRADHLDEHLIDRELARRERVEMERDEEAGW